jgi:hypothetical protein
VYKVVVVVVVVELCAHETGARVARFRACCVKWRWGMVHRGGAMMHTRYWWWWGGAFTKCESQSWWAKKNETSCHGSVLGCSGAARGGG